VWRHGSGRSRLRDASAQQRRSAAASERTSEEAWRQVEAARDTQIDAAEPHRAHVLVRYVVQPEILLHYHNILVDPKLRAVGPPDWHVLLTHRLDEADLAEAFAQPAHQSQADRRLAHVLPCGRDENGPAHPAPAKRRCFRSRPPKANFGSGCE
jgi:hypothetical protein